LGQIVSDPRRLKPYGFLRLAALASDAATLGKVGAEFLAGSVRRPAIICRTPNAYPVRDKIQAVPVIDAGTRGHGENLRPGPPGRV